MFPKIFRILHCASAMQSPASRSILQIRDCLERSIDHIQPNVLVLHIESLWIIHAVDVTSSSSCPCARWSTPVFKSCEPKCTACKSLSNSIFLPWHLPPYASLPHIQSSLKALCPLPVAHASLDALLKPCSTPSNSKPHSYSYHVDLKQLSS